jgi:hypothetical protein
LVCLLAATLFAQNPYGRITGRVIDSSAAVVPGAVVRVENMGTNVETTVVSDSQGNYDAQNLIPGQYQVVAERPGFKRYQRGPIDVRVGDVLTIDIGLELGAPTDSVVVTAETPLLEAATANIGQVIDRRRLVDLSMPASNVSYLIQLAPGVISTAAPTQGWQLNGTSTQANFSSNGSGVQTSQFTVDGIPNMLSYGEVDNHAPFPEVLQEFRVQTAPFDASAGHFVGSEVDMVIRSGTNALHGDGVYQYNGRVLNAIPFFAERHIYDLTTGPITQEKINSIVPSVVMNRYRVAVSGPIYIPKLYNGRNRTFFTYGYDNVYRALGTVTPQSVPTAAERRGDFSALLALGSQYQIYDPATITPHLQPVSSARQYHPREPPRSDGTKAYQLLSTAEFDWHSRWPEQFQRQPVECAQEATTYSSARSDLESQQSSLLFRYAFLRIYTGWRLPVEVLGGSSRS